MLSVGNIGKDGLISILRSPPQEARNDFIVVTNRPLEGLDLIVWLAGSELV